MARRYGAFGLSMALVEHSTWKHRTGMRHPPPISPSEARPYEWRAPQRRWRLPLQPELAWDVGSDSQALRLDSGIPRLGLSQRIPERLKFHGSGSGDPPPCCGSAGCLVTPSPPVPPPPRGGPRVRGKAGWV